MEPQPKNNTCRVTVFAGAVKDFEQCNILPPYAEEELKKITNSRIAAEKRAGYGLLSLGAERLGLDFNAMACFKGNTGKPMHPKLWFSISHSAGVVAVAITDIPVGIDIESTESREQVKRLEKRILCPGESYDDALMLWTMKEAVFKLEGKDRIFRPADVNTAGHCVISREFQMDGKDFMLSVAIENEADVELYCV